MNLNDSSLFLDLHDRSTTRGLLRLNKSNAYEPSANRSYNQKTFTPNESTTFGYNNETFGGMIDFSMADGSAFAKIESNGIKQKTDRLYEQFLDIAQCHTNDAEVFDTIQDMIETCGTIFDDILRSGGRLNEKQFASGFGWLNEERNTWKLLHCLYKDRLQSQNAMEGTADDDFFLYSSEKEIIDKLYEHNRDLREYQLIVDWLEQCDNQQYIDKVHHFMDETISWENTLHQLQNIDGTVFGGNKAIVKSLDPDAPHRESLPLHDLDAEDEERISKEILYEIRRGRLDEAGALCERVGQFWRAAVLEGWRLHNDPNYTVEGSSSEKYAIEGNPRRNLWKKLAWQMAENGKINEYTRAYLGVFCGNLDALKGPLSNSWFDLLWAYLKVQIDIRVEYELRAACAKSYIDMPQEYWKNEMTMEKIFDELGARDSIRDVAEHQMTAVRKYLILDDIQELMRNINDWLNGLKNNGHMLRFVAHIVLFMRQIGKIPTHQIDIANNVIQTYVEFLISGSFEPAVVAFYTASLPDALQTCLYSKFLEGIFDQEKDKEKDVTIRRKMALEEAEANRLDVRKITTFTVAAICMKQTPPDAAKELAGAVSKLDEEKISSLEWLTFDFHQYGELLWHSNALIRYFLGENKIAGIRKIFEVIPSNAIQQITQYYISKDNLPAKVECSISEYAYHNAYLDALDSYNDWLRLYHSKPKEPELVGSNANFTERMASEHKQQAFLSEMERWKINLIEQTAVTRDKMYETLFLTDKGYLVDPDTANPVADDDKAKMDNRLKQLQGLRKLCIPQIILLVHNIMHSAGDYKGAISVADKLMSDDYQLHTVYSKHELTEILAKIAESSLAAMNEQMDPWGYSTLVN